MERLFYGSFQSDDARIHYYRTGDLKPPVILLHGFTDNGLCWNQIPLLLELEYDVILWDMRGHGASQTGSQTISTDLMAEDVLRLVEHLQLKQPVLMGHSMGADIAARAGARMPKNVRALILEDPPWFLDPSPMDAQQRAAEFKQRHASIQQLKALPIAALTAFGQQEYPLWDLSEFPQWAKSKHQFNLEFLERFDPDSEPWQQVVARLQCPGLLFTADNQRGALVTPQAAALVMKSWKKGKTVPIAGAGHSIHREQFMAFYPQLEAFLRKLGKWKPK